MIKAIVAGNSHLYHELIKPYERCVYRMALSVVKNEADAKDVAQDAFLKSFHHLAGFRAESKFSTWLISITLNEARDRLRREAVASTMSLEALDDESALSPALLRDWREIPLEIVERKEIRQILHDAVEHFPETYRQVFWLREIEKLNVEETATALCISASLVKVRLHRARIMLQKQLSPLLKRVHRGEKRRRLAWF